MQAKYKRVLLKVSGEALAGENKTGLNPATLSSISAAIKQCVDMGVLVAIVVALGN